MKIQFAHSNPQPCTGITYQLLASTRIHGSYARYLRTAEGGDVLIQEWDAGQHTVYYLTAKCPVKEGFSFSDPSEGHLLWLSLTGRINLLEQQAGSIRIATHSGMLLQQERFQGFCTIGERMEMLILFTKIPNAEVKVPVKFGFDPVMQQQIEKIFSVSFKKHGRFQEEVVNELVDMIIKKSAMPGHETIVDGQLADCVQSFKAYLDGVTGKIPRIATWCTKNGIGQRTLSQLFHSVYGKTIREYILKSRLEKAVFTIIHSKRPLKQIARDAGYRSYTNFSSALKKQYGSTPRAMRKEKQTSQQ